MILLYIRWIIVDIGRAAASYAVITVRAEQSVTTLCGPIRWEGRGKHVTTTLTIRSRRIEKNIYVRNIKR